jgi:predicted transcriptional regulator
VERNAWILCTLAAGYFAAALTMLYGRFLEAAELLGYDVELLCARFGASFEQVAHRLTTLARPSARGVPFYLIRADMPAMSRSGFRRAAFPSPIRAAPPLCGTFTQPLPSPAGF